MSEIDSAAWLTVGPRGRRLLWSVISDGLIGPAWPAAFVDTPPPGPEIVAELEPAVERAVAEPVALTAADLLDHFASAVDAAYYWQEPDGVDRALARPEVRAALVPLARMVGAAAPSWWSEPVDLEHQQIVDWVDPHIGRATLSGAPSKLARWRASTVADEQRASERPADVRARWSGWWWSTPCLSLLPTTTRSLDDLGAVGLTLVEDSMGWTAADCRPVTPTIEPRVFEIADARAWVELAANYPLEVSLSRRHDWWRATGVESSWLIPDYAAVSRDYDAVHVTAQAYLTTAGVALPVGSAHTVLAGWNPDQTYWLTDRLVADDPLQRWTRLPDSVVDGWSRT